MQRRNIAPTIYMPGINALNAEFYIILLSFNIFFIIIYILKIMIGLIIISLLKKYI